MTSLLTVAELLKSKRDEILETWLDVIDRESGSSSMRAHVYIGAEWYVPTINKRQTVLFRAW